MDKEIAYNKTIPLITGHRENMLSRKDVLMNEETLQIESIEGEGYGRTTD